MTSQSYNPRHSGKTAYLFSEMARRGKLPDLTVPAPACDLCGKAQTRMGFGLVGEQWEALYRPLCGCRHKVPSGEVLVRFIEQGKG